MSPIYNEKEPALITEWILKDNLKHLSNQSNQDYYIQQFYILFYPLIFIFDNLNTEIIILNADDFSLVWLNDSAKAANWIEDSTKFNGKDIASLLDEKTSNQVIAILRKAKKDSNSITRRDFEITHKSGLVRTLDLTISYSDKKNLILLTYLDWMMNGLQIIKMLYQIRLDFYMQEE